MDAPKLEAYPTIHPRNVELDKVSQNALLEGEFAGCTVILNPLCAGGLDESGEPPRFKIVVKSRIRKRESEVDGARNPTVETNHSGEVVCGKVGVDSDCEEKGVWRRWLKPEEGKSRWCDLSILGMIA